jgi:hypothetical protein
LFSSPASAQPPPVLEAAVAWNGECDQRHALEAEIRARGVVFEERTPDTSLLELAVSVVRDEAGYSAELVLVAHEGRDERRVVARDCDELLRAIAWVLVVFAEERHSARASPAPSAPGAPAGASSAAFPEPTAAPASPPLGTPRTSRTSQAPSASPRPDCRPRSSGVGSDFVVAGGWVPAVSVGAVLFGRYAPCLPWLPGIELSAGHLVTSSYERDGRELSMSRTGGRAVLWFELGAPGVDAGLGLELSRLRATASGTEAGPGGSDSTLWWAIALPVRATLPLLARRLWLRAGADFLYAPRDYSFRYRSGEELAQSSHFELRGLLGLGAGL